MSGVLVMIARRVLRSGAVERRVGGDRATHVLEEDLEDTTSLLVDEARDTLHTATTGETTDSLWSLTTKSLVSSLPHCPWDVEVQGRQRTGLVIPWMLSRRILR